MSAFRRFHNPAARVTIPARAGHSPAHVRCYLRQLQAHAHPPRNFFGPLTLVPAPQVARKAQQLRAFSSSGAVTSPSAAPSTTGSTSSSSASPSSAGSSTTPPRTSKPSRSKRAFLAFAVASYLAYGSYSDDFALKGPRRGFRFWFKVGPLLSYYLYHNTFYNRPVDHATAEQISEDEQAWEALHEYGAEVAYNVILDLRGFYIKAGQFMSARPDMLPGQYIEKFRRLQNEIPSGLGSDEVAQILNAYYFGGGSGAVPGDSRERLPFTDLSPEPLGAASIGQAHTAKIHLVEAPESISSESNRTSGTSCSRSTRTPVDCVLKLQYPDARLLFRVDIECIRCVVYFLAPQLNDMFSELKKQFLCEFDYRREKENLQRMRANMQGKNTHRNRYFREENVAVPAVFEEYCREKVLVMEVLPGVKLEDGLFGKGNNREFLNMSDINARMQNRVEGRSSTASTDAASSSSTSGTSSSAPAIGGSLATFWLDYLPFVLRITYALELLYYRLLEFAFFFGRWSSDGRPRSNTHQAAVHDLDGAAGKMNSDRVALLRKAKDIAHLLLQVHGEQIFHHGFFQGDPHPGNFLLMPDGRLGLIDFGQAKTLTKGERRKLALLVCAVADDDKQEIVRVMREEYGFGGGGGGGVSEPRSSSTAKEASDFVLEKLARSAFGGLDSKLTDGKSIQEFSQNFRKQYRGQNNGSDMNLPAELYLPMRTAVLLRGISLLLHQFVSPAEMWAPMARKCLEEIEGEEGR